MGKRINNYSVQSVKLVRESAKVYDLESAVIRSPRDAYKVFNSVLDMENLPNEHFVMLSLNTKNEVVGVHTIFVGSLNSSIVHPREVFQRALLNNAASIMVAHNHPSGNPTPSPEDIDVTKRLKEAGGIVGIELLDHIIIGHEGRYFSLREKGYIK